MQCRCKSNITIADFEFKKGSMYEYETSIHEETDMLIYHVRTASMNKLFTSGIAGEIPFTELKFDNSFDNLQELREKKLNQILK